MKMVPIVMCFIYLLATNMISALPSQKFEDHQCKSDVLPTATKEFSQYMSKSVKPCDNFYRYVCENSITNAKTVVEARIKAFSTKFHRQRVERNTDLNDVKTKARLLYQMCMDMEGRRKRGITPFLEYVKALTGLDVVSQDFDTEKFDWMKAVATLAHAGHFALFVVYIDGENVKFFKESSLTTFNKCKIENILIETGLNANIASETAEEIVKFGVDLDSVKEDSHTATLEVLTFQELQSKIPDIDWRKYFQIANGNLPSQRIILYNPSYFYSLQRKLDQASSKTIANYIFLRALMGAYPALDGRYNEVIDNVDIPSAKKYDPDPESWCLRTASFWIEEAVESAYVRTYFNDKNKTEATELVDFLKKAFTDNHWTDAKMKEKISKDLAKINFQVGCPDYLLSDEVTNDRYKDLKIIPGKYYESQENAMIHRRLMDHKKWKSKDDSWFLGPTLVNIYPGENKITIPAGQLQPPYYHHCYPEAINFGAVGTIIANTIIHEVEQTSSCISSSSYGNVPGTESVRYAYKAYTDWVKSKQPKEDLILPGLKDVSDKQLFFIAYTHSFCGGHKPKTENLIRSALSKLSEFAEVFNCPVGSNMNPEKKCFS